MKKILIILNAVVNNRGSEALIRGISSVIKEKIPDSYIYLSSTEPTFVDMQTMENIDCNIQKSTVTRNTVIRGGLYVAIKKVLKNKNVAARFRYSGLLKVAKQCDLVLIIGADNYDASYGLLGFMHELHSMLRKEIKGKMLIYDCSIGKRDLSKELEADIALFDGITVREHISYNNIANRVSKDKLKYFPDPAFVMKAESVPLPDGFKENDTVGINLSNLILNSKYGNSADKILLAYYKVMDYILSESKSKIMLVPHVMNGADITILSKLYDKYKSTGRVILLGENYSAPQLKYLISKCIRFVGARTHSTIAAYSTMVPTLVLGYSVKSVGIAQDLFGTDENYVLSVSKMEDANELLEHYKWLMENEENIKTTLNTVIPEYQKKVWETGDYINLLLD